MTPTAAALAERTGMAAARFGIRPPPVPAPLFDTYYAVMQARVVMAATSLGVFAALAERAYDSRGLSQRLGIDERGLDALLYALHALGYARGDRAGTHRLTRTARRWLTPASGKPLDRVVGEFNYDDWDHFSALEDVLRGAPPVGLHERDRDDPYWARYQGAMEQFAALVADATARAIRLRNPRTLLDLGGGPGTHAAAMCRRHPNLEATIVELEGAVRHTPRDGETRITYRAADLFRADLGGGYDVVTAHSLLHNLPPAKNVELLRRARGALRPGGTVAVLELERAPAGRAGTQIGALTGVLFWTLQHTRTYTAEEIRAWMAEAGFTRIRARRPPALAGSVLVTARR